MGVSKHNSVTKPVAMAARYRRPASAVLVLLASAILFSCDRPIEQLDRRNPLDPNGSNRKPAAVLTHPQSLTVRAGEPASFSVEVEGFGVHYIWRRNNSVYGTSDAATLTIAATTMADSGAVIDCIVYNDLGRDTSDQAILHVRNTPPQNPAGLSVACTAPMSLVASWRRTANTTAYELFRSLPPDTHATLVARTADTSVTDYGLQPNRWYRYVVRAANSGGVSPFSDSTGAFTAPAGMVPLAGGSFQMGLTGASDASPLHRVTVSPFCIDTVEVTQACFIKVMGRNPALYTGDTLRPVENVTWFDALLFCNARSRADGLDTVYRYQSRTMAGAASAQYCTGISGLEARWDVRGYRLATEAQWEFACRAGVDAEAYWGSAAATGYAWYSVNAAQATHQVAQKQPNGWRVFDMAGNVYEWCWDIYGAGYYAGAPQTDPVGPETGSDRVIRGGSIQDGVPALRAGARNRYAPASRSASIGIRCVCPTK